MAAEMRVVRRGVTGAVAWGSPRLHGWHILWYGPGSGLYLTSGGRSSSLVRIEHWAADGQYRSEREAARAARAFIEAPPMTRGSRMANRARRSRRPTRRR